MLWYKGWLETRWRLFICVAFYIAVYILAALHPSAVRTAPIAAAMEMLQSSYTVYAMAFTAIILGGAGIDTRPAFQGDRGMHESRLFTLSLPVTRLRLLAVRASLGWMEMAASLAVICIGSWAALWPLRESIEPGQILRFTIACIACATGLYAVSTLLSSFLDGTWKFQISVVVFAAIWWVLHHFRIPVSVDIFWGIKDGESSISYTMPWTAMAISIACAALLFMATLKIVRTREY